MKKRELIEKIVMEGCEDVDCYDCSFTGHDSACSLPGDTAVVFAKQWLVAHLKKDKPCPRCDGNGTVSELAMSPNGSSSTMTPKKCPLCLGTGNRIPREDLEKELVMYRERHMEGPA